MREGLASLDQRLLRMAACVAAAGLIVLALSRLVVPLAAPPFALGTLKLAYGPADYRAALDLADGAVALGAQRARARPQDWINQESLARALMGRARLTGSFDDLAAAGAALARGKAEATANTGPLMTDAVFAMMVHRAGPVAADLAAAERSAMPPGADEQAEIVAMRGDVAFYAGEYAAARARYRQAAGLADGPGTAFRIAQWQKKTGDFDGALHSFARAAQINRGRTPQFIANVYLQSGSVALERGDWPEAERLFRRADATFPGYWLIEAHCAQMLALRGDLPGAARRYRAIAERSGAPEVMDALAALYRAQAEGAASRAWAARAGAIWARRLRQLPEAAFAHALEHELALGDPMRALALARSNMAARPYGDSATLLAYALLAAGQPGEARDVLERLGRTPWRTGAQYAALSQAYALLGDAGRSAAALAAAKAISPRAADPATPLIWFGHH